MTLSNGIPDYWPDRFRDRIEIEPEGCWLWIGYRTPGGYGQFSYDGRSQYAHRFAYQNAHGEIPKNADVCHSCDVRNCVRPDHLFAGSRKDNVRDMITKGRASWQIDPASYREFGRQLGASLAGENSPCAKLTARDVDVIRYLLERGALDVDIATVFNVHKSTIASIANGRTWQ